MSCHVGTRWYRAPEISFLERQYDQASDIWSLGCVFYEIMFVIQNNTKPQSSDPRDCVLFKGDSCFPLSKCSEEQNNNKSQGDDVHLISEADQLKIIFEKTGQNSEEDLSFISSNNAVKYVNNLVKNTNF